MKRMVDVTFCVEVEIDESKFDDEFFSQFNSCISDYGDDLEEHMNHLAYQHIYNSLDSNDFIEGYGLASDMGIKFDILDVSYGGY